jgi:hypothetical protein
MVGTTKDRTKTHVGREIETALTSLNDQHAYFLFLEFQFLEQIRGLTITSAMKVTTEAFPRNRYAPKIRVRIRDLQAFGYSPPYNSPPPERGHLNDAAYPFFRESEEHEGQQRQIRGAKYKHLSHGGRSRQGRVVLWSPVMRPLSRDYKLGDPPMHEDCAEFASTTCPFLFGKKLEYSDKPVDHENAVIPKAPMAPRPDRMFIMRTHPKKFAASKERVQKLGNLLSALVLDVRGYCPEDSWTY